MNSNFEQKEIDIRRWVVASQRASDTKVIGIGRWAVVSDVFGCSLSWNNSSHIASNVGETGIRRNRVTVHALTMES